MACVDRIPSAVGPPVRGAGRRRGRHDVRIVSGLRALAVPVTVCSAAPGSTVGGWSRGIPEPEVRGSRLWDGGGGGSGGRGCERSERPPRPTRREQRSGPRRTYDKETGSGVRLDERPCRGPGPPRLGPGGGGRASRSRSAPLGVVVTRRSSGAPGASGASGPTTGCGASNGGGARPMYDELPGVAG